MAEAFGITLVFFGIALFSAALVALIWPLPKLRMGSRKAAAIGLALAVGSCVAGAALVPTPPRMAGNRNEAPTTASKRTESSSSAKEQREKEAQEQRVLAGWNELLATVAPCDEANTRLAEYVETIEGSGSMYQAYDLARHAAQTCTSTWMGLNDLDAPQLPSDALEQGFEDALQTCQTAYFLRKKSLETAQAIFDGDFRPSALARFKEQASSAQGGILSCVAGYMSAAGKAGVDMKLLSSKS